MPTSAELRAEAVHPTDGVGEHWVYVMEQQYPERARKNLLSKIEIPEEAIPAAREFLLDAGINEASIYPDVDGFTSYLKSAYGIPK